MFGGRRHVNVDSNDTDSDFDDMIEEHVDW